MTSNQRIDAPASVPLTDFEPAGGDARLEFGPGPLLVVSPAQAWAYAAILRLDPAVLPPGRTLICIKTRVRQGYMGFGILNAQRDAFLTEEGVRSGAGVREVRLRIEAIGQASDLVVRNWAGGDNASQAEIEAVTIEAYPPGESEIEAARVGTARGAASLTLSQYWLRRYIESLVPVLTGAAASDWRRVCALRDWVYANIPLGESKASILEAKHGYEIYNEPVERIVQRLNEGEGGFLCAGMSIVLQRLYDLFGYVAYTYNMGSSQSDPTHMVCLVDIEHEGRTITTVQDALFNLSYARGSAPLDFLDLLNLLRQRRGAEVELVRGGAATKPLVGSPEQVQRWMELHRNDYQIGPMLVTAGQARVTHNLSLHNYDRRSFFEDWIESQIGERNMLCFHLFPLGTSGGLRASQLVEAAERAREEIVERAQR